MLGTLSQWLQGTPWLVPSLQILHILAISALMIAMLRISLRLASVAGQAQSLAQTARRYSPLLWGVLPVLLFSGGLLIVSEPARALNNNLFRIKMLLLTLAILLTCRVTAPLTRNPAYWDGRRGIARLAALALVLLWTGIVFAGRWIAYT